MRIGEVGPRTLALAGTVNSRTTAAASLEAALRGAGTEPELAGARVFWLYDRVIVVPGAKGGEVVFTGTDADNTTVDELALGPEHALTTRALRSAPLPATVTLSNPTPQVAVTIGPVGPRVITPPSGVEPEVARRLALGGDRVGGRGSRRSAGRGSSSRTAG